MERPIIGKLPRNHAFLYCCKALPAFGYVLYERFPAGSLSPPGLQDIADHRVNNITVIINRDDNRGRRHSCHRPCTKSHADAVRNQRAYYPHFSPSIANNASTSAANSNQLF